VVGEMISNKTEMSFKPDALSYTIALRLVVNQDRGYHTDPRTGKLRRDHRVRRRMSKP